MLFSRLPICCAFLQGNEHRLTGKQETSSMHDFCTPVTSMSCF
jgi:hypothetical protein